MRAFVTDHVLLFALGIGVALGCLAWTERNHDKTATTEFGVFLACLVLWSALQIAELLGGRRVDYAATFLTRATRAFVAVSWFSFTATYAGYGDAVRSTTGRLVVGAGLAVLLVFTAVPPVAVRYTFSTVQYVTHPVTAVSLGQHGPLRLIPEVVGYAFVLVGTVVLAYRFLGTRYTRWWQTGLLVASVAAVVVFDRFLRFQFGLAPGLDYSAVETSVVSALFVLACYRNDLFSFAPVAREHVFHTIEDAVVVVNPAGVVIDYNEAAVAVWPDLAVDRGLGDVLPNALDGLAAPHADGGENPTVEVTRDARERYYETHVSPLREPGGGAVVIFRDVTDRERRERRLHEQNERLDEFAGLVSHDLRNPLQVADGYLELAREDPDGGDEHLERVADAHDRMGDLIEDLLRLASEDDVAAGATVETLDVGAFARECWEHVETGDATLAVESSRAVRADPGRLARLFENLYRNSVEHGSTGSRNESENSVEHSSTGSRSSPTPENSVEHSSTDADVTVTVGRTPGGFYVADDGPGIPERERERVFEAGYTTDADGTGYGLHIVREVARAHGWDVAAVADDADGARFEVTGVETE